MCGIVGIVNFSSNKIERELLNLMCLEIKHRGPDSQNTAIFENGKTSAGIGISRLSVIDLETGTQPMFNEDGKIAVVLNGEIYNYQELRARLEKNHIFKTKSDTEVIAHLYEEFGSACVDDLRGMFSFALWDDNKKELFVAKDRLGKKPLYYTFHNGSFIFASEIKSILKALPTTPQFSPDSIDLFLTYRYIPSPQTIFSGIQSLLPGHKLFISQNNEARTERYWSVDFTQKTELGFDGACDKIKELLLESTRLRMIADVPLGAFLSGGVDSAIVVSLMKQLASTNVKTFTIGFDEADFSELKHARITAKHFGTQHNEILVKPNFLEMLPKVAWHYGQPFADPSALASFAVSHETRKSVTVALNGDGGDEAFGGYIRYRALKYSQMLSNLLCNGAFLGFISKLIPSGSSENKNILRYASRFLSAASKNPAERNLLWHSYAPDSLRNSLYTTAFSGSISSDSSLYLLNAFNNSKASDLLDKAFECDINTFLPECLLVKMDVASMAYSLEARSPFLDHKVIEFSATLPSEWKINSFSGKHILKETFKNSLPADILKRGKTGFGVPVSKWLRGDWSSYFKETVLGSKSTSRGILNPQRVNELYLAHLSGKENHGELLYSILMLEEWFKAYID